MAPLQDQTSSERLVDHITWLSRVDFSAYLIGFWGSTRASVTELEISPCPQEREHKLQANLIARIEPYCHGDKDAFVHSASHEAERLAKAASGKTFLHTIG